MKSLYIFNSPLLSCDNTVKFGMSNIKELPVYERFFANIKYLFFYVFDDKYSEKDISNIEKIILKKTIDLQNPLYQSGFLYCHDINSLHDLIINVLKDNNIVFSIDNNPPVKHLKDIKIISSENDDDYYVIDGKKYYV